MEQKRQQIIRNAALLLGFFLGTFVLLLEGSAQRLDNSLLWKLEGKGINTTYIYGTFHILPQADFELKEKVKIAFDRSEQIALELDMDNPNLQQEMMQHLGMKGGMTLDQLYTEDELAVLDTFLISRVGAGVEALKTLKPFVITSMILPSMLGEAPASFEGTFVQMAMEQQKDIKGLETIAFQMAVFDDISYQSQANDLYKMISDQQTTTHGLQAMITFYKEENIDGLYEFMVSEIGDPDQVNVLLADRNKDWIPRIAELAKAGTTFIGVGAGHLGGEEGVINLLKKAGYKVQPVQ